MDAKPQIFNIAGVIPPVDENDGTSLIRSPYTISIINLIELFAFTEERKNLLEGLLRYRAELYKAGVMSGYQWLNGSFTTHIEILESRPPNDIDVVTFFNLPEGETQLSFLPRIKDLFTTKLTKLNYKVDAYPVILGQNLTYDLIERITYWYSMWSHRKSDNLWKGFIQIPLNYEEDQQAIMLLDCKGGTT